MTEISLSERLELIQRLPIVEHRNGTLYPVSELAEITDTREIKHLAYVAGTADHKLVFSPDSIMVGGKPMLSEPSRTLDFDRILFYRLL